MSDRDGNDEIYIMDANGTDQIRLTYNNADDEEPDWSPDGTHIVFSSFRDGHYEIYVMNANGDNQTRLTYTNGHAIQPDWCPTGSTGIDEQKIKGILPNEFKLFQNYPNPFNPSTIIKFQLPIQSLVSLRVYDALGNEIETLVDGEKPAGSYELELNESGLISGVYFYQLRTINFMETKKMILLK